MPHLYRESTVVLEAHPRVARICLQRREPAPKRDVIVSGVCRRCCAVIRKLFAAVAWVIYRLL